MRIQLLKENLHRAMTTAGKFATQKAQLPILSQVGLVAGEDGIYLSATDLDVGVRLRVGGKVVEPGSVALPAKLMAELTANLPLGPVELTSNKEGHLELTAGRVKAKIQGMGMADFPVVVTEGEGEVLGEWPIGQLEKLLRQVEFAVSRDETRPVLTGILWDRKGDKLVATDGYRLSMVRQMKSSSGDSKVATLLVSGRWFAEGVSVAKEWGVEKVALTYYPTQKQAQFKGPDAVVAGRILEGEYPHYEAILPGELTIEATADRQELLQAVKTASIFARDSAHIVRFLVEGAKMVVSANAPNVGENQVEVELTKIKEGTISIAFNSRYLTDFFTHAEGERVGFGFTDALKPGVFWETERRLFEHVIMPVRVREGD